MPLHMFFLPFDLSLSLWNMSVLLFCVIFSYLGHDVNALFFFNSIQALCQVAEYLFLFFCIPSVEVFLILVCFACIFFFSVFSMLLSDKSSLNICCISSSAILGKLLLSTHLCGFHFLSECCYLFSLQLPCWEPLISHAHWAELDKIIFICMSRIQIQ